LSDYECDIFSGLFVMRNLDRAAADEFAHDRVAGNKAGNGSVPSFVVLASAGKAAISQSGNG
jgi:hypothetical protein